MKQVTLNQIEIKVEGEVTLKLWGGGTGTINMKPFILKGKEVTKDNILGCINDGGFGCESITNAWIDIYDLYENGYKEFNRSIFTDCKHHTNLFLRGIKPNK